MDISDDIEHLYRTRKGLVREAIKPFEPNPEKLEDLEQDVWLAVWESKDTFNGTAELTTWITGVAKNVGRNHVRGALREMGEEYGEEIVEEDVDSWTDILVTSQADPALEVAVTADLETLWSLLTDVQRDILEAKVYGLDTKEVADLTGLSTAAVRVHLHRARRIFAEYIRGEA